MLEGGSRTATCKGAGSGVIGAISFDNLDTLHEEDPELAVKLFTAFGIAGVAKLRARLTSSQGEYSKRRSGTRMEHCSYRYSVLFDLIPLLMSSIESFLSNKPKQCILKNQIVEM